MYIGTFPLPANIRKYAAAPCVAVARVFNEAAYNCTDCVSIGSTRVHVLHVTTTICVLPFQSVPTINETIFKSRINVVSYRYYENI